MKLKNIFYSFLAVFVVYLSACQKEVNSVDDVVPVNVVTDSNYLSKVYNITSTAGVIDTSNLVEYFYDNLKRVTKVVYTFYGTNGYIFNSDYFYNGNDTLPYKSIDISNESNYKDTIASFFYYDPNGNRIKDSLINNSFTVSANIYEQYRTINTYQYSPGKIYGYSYDTLYYSTIGTIGEADITHDTATVDGNGNLVANRKVQMHSSTGFVYHTSDATVTYDNKPSPYSLLSNFKTLAVFPFGETFFYEMPQKNNRLHITETDVPFGSGYDEDLTGDYSYKTNGLPSQILIPDLATPGDYEKYVFIYKSL